MDVQNIDIHHTSFGDILYTFFVGTDVIYMYLNVHMYIQIGKSVGYRLKLDMWLWAKHVAYSS